MRKLVTAILVLSATAMTTVAADARHYRSPLADYYFGDHVYPWCAQGRGVGYPGDCNYATYSQCEASASGRGLYCNVNPVVAFARVRQGLPASPPVDRYGAY
ncbi:MAG TPA: DUF3551 domain-containing protein [Bradyrhizobium sp.]|nr:DUF3551 domain-containing protein [Bradyrhizobium sp.]